MWAEDSKVLLGLLELPITIADGLGIQTTLEVLLEVWDEGCRWGVSEGYLEVDMPEDLFQIFY